MRLLPSGDAAVRIARRLREGAAPQTPPSRRAQRPGEHASIAAKPCAVGWTPSKPAPGHRSGFYRERR